MSTISGKGYLITTLETKIQCPICTSVFDAGGKIDKAKYPVFNTKCLNCKGKITISVPIMGGVLRCWETNVPKSVERVETITHNTHNGIPYKSDL